MFFRKRKDYRRSWIPRIFRLFLSLVVLSILAIGVVQAYRNFSGFGSLKITPQSLASLLTSESAYQVITGLLTLNPSQSIDSAKKLISNSSTLENQNRSNTSTSGSELSFKFAVVSDSHLDTQNLSKALIMAKTLGAKFVIGLGDFSDVGTVDQLKASKEKFDQAGITYYVIPGDHDLWDSRDKGFAPTTNFTDVFATPPYQSFSYQNVRIIMIYNSDNYLGLDELQLKWIDDTLFLIDQEKPSVTFAFASIPLFHPSSDHVMGKTNSKLKNQGEHLSSIFKKHGVSEVLAGDTHSFSRYTDPSTDLNMTSVGAVTSVRNPQAPRFAIIDIYKDGSYNIEDLEIK